jgi:hypothetical protein
MEITKLCGVKNFTGYNCFEIVRVPILSTPRINILTSMATIIIEIQLVN